MTTIRRSARIANRFYDLHHKRDGTIDIHFYDTHGFRNRVGNTHAYHPRLNPVGEKTSIVWSLRMFEAECEEYECDPTLRPFTLSNYTQKTSSLGFGSLTIDAQAYYDGEGFQVV
jgi:hypothetical protein